jgi:hypothetical protein
MKKLAIIFVIFAFAVSAHAASAGIAYGGGFGFGNADDDGFIPPSFQEQPQQGDGANPDDFFGGELPAAVCTARAPLTTTQINYIIDHNMWDYVRSTRLTRGEMSRIGGAMIHKGHREFWSSPITQKAITYLSLIIPIGEGVGLLSNIIRTGVNLITKQAVKEFMKYQKNFILKSGWKNWGNYMNKRGWTFNDIQQTLLNGKWQPHSGTNWLNPGNSMSVVTNPNTGKSLIIDNITKEIIHLGKKGYVY